MRRSTLDAELVNVSDLNQYLYCPRRLWYLRFQHTQGRNYQRAEGKSKHDRAASRGKWIKELYLESKELRLKGKIDVLDREDHQSVPVERKRSSSGAVYWNDEVQLAAYALLLEGHVNTSISCGIVYLWETDERIEVDITNEHRTAVEDCIDAILSLESRNPPPLVDNPNKCEKCSTREYCMPEETAILEPHQAEGTGWEDRV